MMISCWCTYCLQAGFMNVKVHFLWCIYIICSDAYSQDTCNSLLSLICLCIHMFLHSIITWLHTCRVSLCMLHVLPKLYLLLFISLCKAFIWAVINYQKGGDCTSAPWVILVINENISLVGLTLLSSIFQISSTLEWHGLKGVGTPSRC